MLMKNDKNSEENEQDIGQQNEKTYGNVKGYFGCFLNAGELVGMLLGSCNQLIMGDGREGPQSITDRKIRKRFRK